jgi:putative nucleotidyltransferase with HDIG domain
MTAALTREPRREVNYAADIDLPIAQHEVRSLIDFDAVDLEKTKQAQDAAVAKVPAYYQVRQLAVERQMEVLHQQIAAMEAARPAVEQAVLQALREAPPDHALEDEVQRAVLAHAQALKGEAAWKWAPEAPVLALWLTPDPGSVPQRAIPGEVAAGEAPAPAAASPMTFTTGDTLAALAVESLGQVLAQGLREPELDTGQALQRVVVLNQAAAADPAGEVTLAEVPDPRTGAELLSARLKVAAQAAAQNLQQGDDWARLHDAAFAMAAPLLAPNITYDEIYTAGARERAREAAEPQLRKYAAGEIIQDAHKRWTDQSRTAVNTYLTILEGEDKPSQRVLSTAAAHLILSLLVILCLARTVHIQGYLFSETTQQHFNLALLLVCALLVIGRVAFYFEPSGFLLPVAACGVLYAILVNVRLAAMVSFLTAVLISAQYGYDWRLLIVSSAMGLAGVFSIMKVRRRSDMASAAVKAVLIGSLAMLAITLATDSLFSEAALRRQILIALNGGICLLAVPGLLSPLERLFNITTDIQLLEYSDLNNELLGQLALKAPGTYSHSLMLGQLAEAAADAIGANGLLARVCAYYHDIGKMRKSQYFCENQTGENLHDNLSPKLSARTISSHVVLGAEMAREFHLPKPIIDGIWEHHGTTLIGYFYQQALEKNGADVKESDFRYPGPKPQRPETAILMICDATESGVRTLTNPDQESVRAFIDRIIAARSADRQFDECDLTLKQLNIIAEVLTQRLVAGMHTRVVYPAPRKEEQAQPPETLLPLQEAQ